MPPSRAERSASAIGIFQAQHQCQAVVSLQSAGASAEAVAAGRMVQLRRRRSWLPRAVGVFAGALSAARFGASPMSSAAVFGRVLSAGIGTERQQALSAAYREPRFGVNWSKQVAVHRRGGLTAHSQWRGCRPAGRSRNGRGLFALRAGGRRGPSKRAGSDVPDSALLIVSAPSR